jgi:hypothetical protein
MKDREEKKMKKTLNEVTMRGSKWMNLTKWFAKLSIWMKEIITRQEIQRINFPKVFGNQIYTISCLYLQ